MGQGASESDAPAGEKKPEKMDTAKPNAVTVKPVIAFFSVLCTFKPAPFPIN
jgi:hypothetical protein